MTHVIDISKGLFGRECFMLNPTELIDISSSVFRSGKNPEISGKPEMCFKVLAKK
jgi:hypothetical protein